MDIASTRNPVPPESHAVDNRCYHHRLKLLQHEKRHPPCDTSGTQDHYDDQLSGLHLSTVKN